MNWIIRRILAARLQGQIQTVIDTGKRVKDETLYTDVNGHEEFYEYLFSPVVSEGRVIAVSGTTRVITEVENNARQN